MDAIHIHLLLNHIPVIGSMFAALLLAFALLRGNEELKRLSLVLFVVAAVVAAPVYLTGEPAEDAVENLSGVSHAIIEQHEDAAKFSMISIIVTGALSLFALITMLGRKGAAKWLSYVLLLSSFATAGLMTWTANLGGQIRHTEIRSGDSVIPQPETKTRDKEKDDH